LKSKTKLLSCLLSSASSSFRATQANNMHKLYYTILHSQPVNKLVSFRAHAKIHVSHRVVSYRNSVIEITADLSLR